MEAGGLCRGDRAPRTRDHEERRRPCDSLWRASRNWRLLRAQWEQTLSLEVATGQMIPTVFHWNDRGTMKAIHPKVLYRRWKEACRRAGVPKRIPHDFRRTAVRNLERAGVPRSVAMKLTGHKTEAVYRRYAIVCEADLTEGLRKLAALEETLRGKLPPWGIQTDLSHSLATVPAMKPQVTPQIMAEGARFELAVPLRGLRFSRPARSATPSPLRIPASGLQSSSFIKPSLIIEAPCLSRACRVERCGGGACICDRRLCRLDALKPPHIWTQGFRNAHGSVSLLVLFQYGYHSSADGETGTI